MQNLIPTSEEWEELNSKTFKCQIGVGNFEKESVELSFKVIPTLAPTAYLALRIDLDASLKVGDPDQIEDKVGEVLWNRSYPVFFDPVNMVALLQLRGREAYYLTRAMVDYCGDWMGIDVFPEPDPITVKSVEVFCILHPVNLLRIRFSQTGLNIKLLHHWMKAIGWDGQPGDPAKSFRAFPDDISRPPEPFPRILMEVEGFRAFGKFYQTGTFTDFILASGDGKELKVHRNVIAAACEVFHNMLTHETKEKQNGLCRIDNIDFETLRLLVDVLYGFPVEESRMKIHCEKLFIAAEMYQLLELKMNCVTYLGESMELEKIVDLYKFAKDNYLDDGLPEKIARFVAQRFDEFLDSGGVVEVAEKIPKYSGEFFRHVVNLRLLG